MSLPPPPPGPPQSPPPGWGPTPGPGTPPPDAPTQVPGGWGAVPPPPGPPAPPQGPQGWGGPDPGKGGGGRRTGLIVGIVALVVLVVGGVVGGAVFALRGDDDETTTTTAETDGESISPSTDTSSSDATDAPTDGSGTGGPSGQESEFTPYAPTDDTSDDVTLDVKKADFPGDWNFRLGEKKFDAKAAGAWDYKTCAEVEAGARLSRQRCKYAVQLNYTAFDGKVRLSQLFLVFDTEPRAKTIQDALVEEDLDLRKGSVSSPVKQGFWVRSSYGNVVVVTLGSTATKVTQSRLEDITGTMNSDFKSALLFMGM